MATAHASSLLGTALAYAAKGWQVFPCHTPTTTGCSCTKREACTDTGKHPRTQHGLHDATTDEATIRRWWTMWPQANIGIRTGAVSGLVVLDVDHRKGGAESLLDLEQSYTPLPETVLAMTGNGEHYLFAHPGQYVKNGVEDFAPGLDIRGDGGYIIAAPSLHENGKRYAWEVLHEPDETPLAPMPEWLLALCQEQVRREVQSAGEPIPTGQRNDTLFRHGCSFRAKGCTEAVILAALREMNATQCQPPLPDEDIRKVAASCAKFAAGRVPEAQQRRNGQEPAPAEEPPLPYSDYTNALAFIRDHGPELRYCFPWKTWLVWTGTYWQRDTSGEVMRRAKATVKRLARQIEGLDDKKIHAIMAHIKSSLSTTKLKALIENAQSEPGMAVQPEDLDTNLWLLNCANGTLDLKTGDLRPHAQTDYITKCLAIPYESTTPCPNWNRFLWRIMGGSQGEDTPDMSMADLEVRATADATARDLIAYLQRTAGYTLTGSTREQCLFLCHGPTKTGKSSYLAALRALLGEYGKQTDMQTFLHKDRPEVRNDLADLAGTRYVYAVESQEGKRLAEGLVKQMTGGVDGIKARFLFENLFEFKPQFKAYIGTNKLPVIKDSDDAIWERIRRIPFVVQIPKGERDKDLDSKLAEELPGILAWAVQGCLEWQRLDDLKEPAPVIDAGKAYRSEMDTLGRFLEECCRFHDSFRIKAGDLHTAFVAWAEGTGVGTMTLKEMGKRLDDRGIEKRTTNYVWRVGLTLKDS